MEADRHANRPARMIYLLKMFPRFSETFVLNEILGLEKLGVEIAIYSLKKPGDGKFHGELGSVRAKARYVPEYVIYALPEYMRAAVAIARRRPGAMLSTFAEACAAFNIYAVKRWMQAVWLSNQLQNEPDTPVHCHFALSAPRVAYFLKKLNGNPYTFTVHAKDLYLKTTKRWLLRRMIANAAGVVTVTDFNRQHLVDNFVPDMPWKIERIYNGIDLDRFIPGEWSGRSRSKILSVSRLVEKKGIEVLIDACALLRDRGIEFQCEIAGDGPLGEALRQRVSALNLDGHVSFLGPIPQDEVRRKLSECALLAAPCIQGRDGNVDALPTILLEALATATPVISTPISGIPEIITDGLEGKLVEPGSAQALASGIADLLNSDSIRAAMGTAGRLKAQSRFDRNSTVADLAGFFAMRQSAPIAHIGYVLTVFPRLSETFILREIQSLERHGAAVTVYSQKRPLEEKRHSTAAALRCRIVYLSPWWRLLLRGIRSHARRFVASPRVWWEQCKFAITRRNLPTAKKFWRAGIIAQDALETGVAMLHSHFISANTRVAHFASRLSGLPYSATAHAKDIYASGLSDKKLKRHVEDAAFVVTISDQNLRYLESKAGASRVCLIPNALDPDEFPHRARSGDSTGPVKILAVGRLVEKKGFHILMSAVAELMHRGIGVMVRIVGDGPERDRLTRMAAETGAMDVIEFRGALTQDEIRSELAWADVLVVPSVPAEDGDIDGMPVVILEAMSSGVPVVASAIAGIPEVVQDKVTGRLVRAGDYGELADAICGSRCPNSLEWAANARSMIEAKYDIRVTSSRLLSLFLATIGKSASGNGTQ